MHWRCRGLLSESTQCTVNAVHTSAAVESQDGEVKRVGLASLYCFVAFHCRAGDSGHIL
jgi:hypothetical protein